VNKQVRIQDLPKERTDHGERECARAYKGLSTPGNKVAENGNKLLPEMATICCRFRQQFVAWCGQALMGIWGRRPQWGTGQEDEVL